MRWIAFDLRRIVADALPIDDVSTTARLVQVEDPRFIYLRSADGLTYQVRCSSEMAACLGEALEVFARDPKRSDIERAACAAAAATIAKLS